jgi:hypothetical protein
VTSPSRPAKRATAIAAPTTPDAAYHFLAVLAAGTPSARLSQVLDDAFPWAPALPPAVHRTLVSEVAKAISRDEARDLGSVLTGWQERAQAFQR